MTNKELYSADYKKYVLSDLEKDACRLPAVKVGYLMRKLKRKARTFKLHPNPDDDFCNPEIGPNYGIVGDYVQHIIQQRRHTNPLLPEPVIVERLSNREYRILNGHHRWLAMCRLGIKRVPIELVNLTHEQEIVSAAERSDRHMCVSFDLDEVLTCDAAVCPADPPLPYPANRFLPQSIRLNVGRLAEKLHEMGFDIWIYTAGYLSSDEIVKLLSFHGIKADGIINGLKNKRVSSAVTNAFRQNYRYIVHPDNESVLWVETAAKAFESIEIDKTADWSAQIGEILQKKVNGLK